MGLRFEPEERGTGLLFRGNIALVEGERFEMMVILLVIGVLRSIVQDGVVSEHVQGSTGIDAHAPLMGITGRAQSSIYTVRLYWNEAADEMNCHGYLFLRVMAWQTMF
jgi:hypothetical protein